MIKILLEKFGYVLYFQQLNGVKQTSYTDENQATYPAQRADCSRPQKPDKFKQIFSIFLQGGHGTFSYHTESHQLSPNGEVRTFV